MSEPQIHQRELIPSDVITALFYSPPWAKELMTPLLYVNDEVVDNRTAYLKVAKCAVLRHHHTESTQEFTSQIKKSS
jgi:hypothetical protein